jgi:serine protease Do
MRLMSQIFVVLVLVTLAATAAEFSNLPRDRAGLAVAVAEAFPVVVELRTRDASPLGLVESGTGSGVVVDVRGYIVTCFHVVSGSAEVTVDIGADRVPAAIVATDEFLDLALVKVDHTFPHAATWGNSATLRPGDFVLVVGYPFDLGAEMTSLGIVSAVRFPMTYPVLAVDAAVNPGNSGGGLFDSRGALVGIPHRLFSHDGLRAFTGIGFAIPGNVARLFVNRNLP